jgi:Domain of unknown function (DUF5664)
VNFQEHMNLLDNDEKSNTELRGKHAADYYSEMMKKNGFGPVEKYPACATVPDPGYCGSWIKNMPPNDPDKPDNSMSDSEFQQHAYDHAEYLKMRASQAGAVNKTAISYPENVPVQASEYLDKISGKNTGKSDNDIIRLRVEKAYLEENFVINHPETPDYESHIRRQNSFVANQNKEELKTKATRSGTKPRYDLITAEFLKSLGETLDHGAKEYGELNWQKADERFAKDAINHLLEHVYNFISGDRSEDHLSHAAVNLMFIQWYNSRNPEWFSK